MDRLLNGATIHLVIANPPEEVRVELWSNCAIARV